MTQTSSLKAQPEQPEQVQMDTPTPEGMSKGNFREEFLTAKPGSPKRLRRLDSCEIDRLLMLGKITPDQHSTLNKFYEDLKKAGLVFSTRASLEPVSTAGSAQFISDRAFARAKRVSSQMNVVVRAVGHAMADQVLDIIQMDKRADRPSLVEGVRKSADALLKEYA